MASIYFHIPFCERKCPYCDFYSIEQRSLQPAFVTALREELRSAASVAPLGEIETIYLGGGTPSLLSPADVGGLLDDVARAYTVRDDAEITLETNPGTVTPAKLAGFRATGVNRLSIGVQSFAPADLQFLGRIHDPLQSEQCILEARRAGFTNVSIDLIYSLPGQDPASWDSTLRRALEIAPEHISAYSLIVEEGTPLYRQVAEGTVRPNDQEVEASLYEQTMETLRGGGYEQYEVSNYARKGFRSRHNAGYWSHGEYRGFGPSAHSFRKDPGGRTGRRWWNVRDLTAYLDRVRRGVETTAAGEPIGEREMINERIFLGLRADGVDVRRLSRDFGVDLAELHRDVLDRLEQDARLTRTGDLLRLTPRGYLLCDEIAEYLMLA